MHHGFCSTRLLRQVEGVEKARHQIKKLEAELKQRINESALQAKSLIALAQERDALAAQAAEAQQVGPQRLPQRGARCKSAARLAVRAGGSKPPRHCSMRRWYTTIPAWQSDRRTRGGSPRAYWCVLVHACA